jgi:nucleotide-binding universal stress UspA family protein
VNRHYEGLREKEQTVKDAHRFFSRTQVDIYSDQCRLMINPVLKLSKPVHNFNIYLDKAQLPANVHQLRSRLKQIFNRIEVLLNDLARLKMKCCPDGLKAPIKQRQNIQQHLKDIATSLYEVNSLMRSFNKEVGLSENEDQSAEAVNTARPTTKPQDQPSPTSVTTIPNKESTTSQSLQNKSYDVFLSYNSKDETEVKKIAEELKAQGIVPWLDKWELPPGRPAQRGLEAEIKESKSAAIFIGKDGLGPWQHMELNAFIQQFVNRDCPVIPVILSDAPPGKPQLPAFLGIMTWVDFRMREPDPIKQLIWGITNKKPEADNSKSIPGGIQPTPADIRQSVQLSFSKKAELANKLLACSCMSNKISRQTVLDMLNDEFRGLTHGIAYGNDDRTDVMNIISKCRDNPGSLQMLVEIVTFFEGETSIHTQQLKDFMRDNSL